MNQLDPKIEDLIVARLSGMIDEQGNRTLDAWLDESPDHQAVMLRCQEIWFSTTVEHDASRFDWTTGFARFKQRIEAQTDDALAPSVTPANSEAVSRYSDNPSRKLHIVTLLRYAAVAATLVALTAVISLMKARHDWTNRMTSISMKVPMGSTTETSLPDGTKVSLNSGTTLSYSQAYGIESRNVSLSGEAYFDIVHNEDMPLDITMAKMTIRDVGTKLNISNYPDDAQAIVTVDEGSVDITTASISEPKRIFAGQQAVVDKSTGGVVIIQKTCDGNTWGKGVLVFNNNTVEEIAKRLERAYDVSIKIHSTATAHKRFFGTFSRSSQDIGDILDALKETGTLSYSINGRQVDIY